MLRGVYDGETTRVITGAPPAPVPVPPASVPVPPGPEATPNGRVTLRRRRPRGTLAALALLAALAAAGIVTALVLANSGSSRHHPGNSSPASGKSAAASPGASSGRPAHSTQAQRTSPSGGTTPAQTSPQSSSPSGQPAAGSGGQGTGQGALPAGFSRFTNSTGFSIGVPNGWGISHQGHYVYLQDPSNSGIYLLIDQSNAPKADPLADWRQQQANRAGSYPDYHLIRLESVSYPQAEKAADWEFTYNRDGVPVHILNRNILANAHHAYALYWSVPEAQWNAYYRYFQAFAATFRPAA
jgi:hypothetical protein